MDTTASTHQTEAKVLSPGFRSHSNASGYPKKSPSSWGPVQITMYCHSNEYWAGGLVSVLCLLHTSDNVNGCAIRIACYCIERNPPRCIPWTALPCSKQIRANCSTTEQEFRVETGLTTPCKLQNNTLPVPQNMRRMTHFSWPSIPWRTCLF